MSDQGEKSEAQEKLSQLREGLESTQSRLERLTALNEGIRVNLSTKTGIDLGWFGIAAGFVGVISSVIGFLVFDGRGITNIDPDKEPFSLTIFSTIIIVTAFIVISRIALAFIAPKQASIPAEDRKLLEPLIIDGNEKAIDQYVRISSLSGSTGVATKLGLTGLPLITVALTLIFSGLAIYQPENGFMDLAKLTLGAFIGSFVQRAATTQAIVSSGKIPES